jgi:hypothetical protein
VDEAIPPGALGTGNPAMAEQLASMPGVWRRLIAEHAADRLGRCAACRNASGSGTRWPCSLHRIAVEASRIYELRLGRSVGRE